MNDISIRFQHLHVPERLEGETQESYHARRRWSRLLGVQRTVVTANPARHRTDAYRKRRRQLVKVLGIRQYKRRIRAIKGTTAAQIDSAAAPVIAKIKAEAA